MAIADVDAAVAVAALIVPSANMIEQKWLRMLLLLVSCCVAVAVAAVIATAVGVDATCCV